MRQGRPAGTRCHGPAHGQSVKDNGWRGEKLKNNLDSARRAVKQVLQEGADQAAVNVFRNRNVSVKYRDGRLEELRDSVKQSLRLEIYADKRYAAHKTSDLRPGGLEKFVKESVSVTRHLSIDKYRALPDPKFYPSGEKRDLKIFDPGFPGMETAARKEMAAALEAYASKQSKKIISVTGGYFDGHTGLSRVHSNGFEGETEKTRAGLWCMVTVRDRGDARPRGWYQAACCFKADLPDYKLVADKAVSRALSRCGQSKMRSGKYPLVLENRIVGNLLRHLHRPMTARAIDQKSSFLEGMINKKIGAGRLTMVDDPFIEKGLGSRLFDGEGLAAKKRTIIEKGTLRDYYIDNYYGRKLGMDPNAGSISNIVLECGKNDLDALIKSVHHGILVTDFIGGNSNGTTGDFSYGIIGHLIKNGKISRPVSEMNISGNHRDLWTRLTETGSDPYPYSPWRTPSLVFDTVDFSGI